ncbi:hypothetical protein TrLO_g13399 [Triparma laevis f. longispina]|uniref:Uncharacterized protein n=1 Tax=Triparma laevis f. longispina TaxID=1714387 RepID=A0A9W7KZZ7_9STRA|nr:hypothetical protein TrLO_g13399 [Triparma laevis f. longispina]
MEMEAGEFHDPIAMCEQKTIDLTAAKEELILEEEILLTERDQIRHAVMVANQKIRELDDSIVRRRVQMTLFDRAISGLLSGFDSIVYTTDQLLGMASGLEFQGNVSDSEEEDEVEKHKKNKKPVVIR